MLHIIFHIALPMLIAAVFYRPRWRFAGLVLVGTMLVDLDHILATPIYDPNRCSIAFHPLHTMPVIVLYVLLAALPFFLRRRPLNAELPQVVLVLHLVGLGLMIHMLLDWLDCVPLAAAMGG